jgi:hypothetical protein
MTDAAPVIAVDLAEVTDEQWFHEHPGRQYRLRPGWAVRRRAGRVFLRTRVGGSRPYPDHEGLAEQLWWRAAWPELPPKTRAQLMKATRWRRKPRQGEPG